MIFVVRMDLKLALHKIAELTATAALRAYKQIESQVEVDEAKELAFYEWTEGGQRKIVVKSNSEKELLELAEKAKAANINFVLLE
jgi:peptidyl-tRNA hydrolase